MKLTNFTINPSPFVRGQISKSFGQGINLNEEIKKDSFQIKDEYDKKVDQEEIQKAHINSYSKTTKSGKQVQVQEHEDKRKIHSIIKKHDDGEVFDTNKIKIELKKNNIELTPQELKKYQNSYLDKGSEKGKKILDDMVAKKEKKLRKFEENNRFNVNDFDEKDLGNAFHIFNEMFDKKLDEKVKTINEKIFKTKNIKKIESLVKNFNNDYYDWGNNYGYGKGVMRNNDELKK